MGKSDTGYQPDEDSETLMENLPTDEDTLPQQRFYWNEKAVIILEKALEVSADRRCSDFIRDAIKCIKYE